jgi:putative transposase
MHERDTKFTASFDASLEKAGIQVRRSAFRAPNTVAFVERLVQSIKQECLDYLAVFGSRHLEYLCREFIEHYHAERPHQGLDNQLLVPNRRQRKR